ncbi:uncharacterized protein LOC122925411 [Bufo gargarizans]|uniref:uncharacterized protein LOC122925411 n=1 Tax=Bufo gargarizans TaxID=30331 RepID=UPI001CF4CC36|nr:uncharacterized protein LOC122925411 [Bufo gargarizans]
MEELLQQLMKRAGSAGGEEWLRSCLKMPAPLLSSPPEVLTSPPSSSVPPLGSPMLPPPPLSLEPPPPAVEESPVPAWGSRPELRTTRGSSSRFREEEAAALPSKRARSAGSACTPPPGAGRRRSTNRRRAASQRGRQSSRIRESGRQSGSSYTEAVLTGVERHQDAATEELQQEVEQQILQDELQGLPVERLPPLLVEPSPGPLGRSPHLSSAAYGPRQEGQPVVPEVPGISSGGGSGWEPMSSTSVGLDLGLMSEAIERSLAPRTWAAYSAAWRDWWYFLNACSMDIKGDVLSCGVLFVTSLFNRKLAASSVAKVVAGVSFFQKLRGERPLSSFFQIKQALKGYKKGIGKLDARRPISISLLGQLCKVLSDVCRDQGEILLFRTAFVLAFFGAFRISELVAASRNSVSGLGFSDVMVSNDKVEILVRKSKTDQYGRGQVVSLHSWVGSEFCPVKLVRCLYEMHPSKCGSFLMHQDSSPLTKFQFSAIFKKCLGKLGLSSAKFSSHSFRIGAATEAARFGLDDSVVKRIGRWESNRFKIYVRPNLMLPV